MIDDRVVTSRSKYFALFQNIVCTSCVFFQFSSNHFHLLKSFCSTRSRQPGSNTSRKSSATSRHAPVPAIDEYSPRNRSTCSQASVASERPIDARQNTESGAFVYYHELLCIEHCFSASAFVCVYGCVLFT